MIELLGFQSADLALTQELLHTFLASILLSSRVKHLWRKYNSLLSELTHFIYHGKKPICNGNFPYS